jgi:hypothetical protein
MLMCLFVVFVLADIFDHRNGSMIRQWFIDEFVAGEDGIDSPYIDGFCKSICICIVSYQPVLLNGQLE